MSNNERYEQRFRACMSSGDKDGLLAVAREVYADGEVDESILAWTAGIVFEEDLVPGFDLLEEFVRRFPASLHMIRVCLADAHGRCGRFDTASCLAREYLRMARDAGAMESLGGSRIIAEGVGRAFLVLTAVYTECGARSYSRRVMQLGLRQQVSDEWHQRYRAEIERIDEELKDPEAARMDEKWEAFFATGANADELHDLALDQDFEHLADRIDLIETQHHFDAGYLVGEEEVWQLVQRSEDQELRMV